MRLRPRRQQRKSKRTGVRKTTLLPTSLQTKTNPQRTKAPNPPPRSKDRRASKSLSLLFSMVTLTTTSNPLQLKSRSNNSEKTIRKIQELLLTSSTRQSDGDWRETTARIEVMSSMATQRTS